MEIQRLSRLTRAAQLGGGGVSARGVCRALEEPARSAGTGRVVRS